jgi:hypothetical protein
MMNKAFKNMLIDLETSCYGITPLKRQFFVKQEGNEKRLYALRILGPNDAVGSFDNGEMWGYELVEMNYWGEYRDHVDIGAYEAIITEGFTEISQEEFMWFVEEKYPNWRNLPCD